MRPSESENLLKAAISILNGQNDIPITIKTEIIGCLSLITEGRIYKVKSYHSLPQVSVL